MSDKEYFEGIRNRVVLVEDHFYKANWPLICSMIKKWDTRSSCDPQDIYQDAVTVVMGQISDESITIEKMSSKLSTYLVSVAKNVFRNHFKKQKSMVDINDHANHLIEDDEENLTEKEKLILEVTILDLVKQIKQPCDSILMDWYIAGLSFDEIAEKYEYKNYNGAKKKKGECLQKARAFVKKNINPETHPYYAR